MADEPLNEEQITDRTRILALTRDQMIEELAELTAEVLRDDRREAIDAVVRGTPGLASLTNFQLRDQCYEYLSEIPESQRLYAVGETPSVRSHYSTVGELIQDLLNYDKVKDRQWRVMMQHDLDGDVLIGARITEIRLDGFHQRVTLYGPKEVIIGEEKGGKAKDKVKACATFVSSASGTPVLSRCHTERG